MRCSGLLDPFIDVAEENLVSRKAFLPRVHGGHSSRKSGARSATDSGLQYSGPMPRLRGFLALISAFCVFGTG